MEYWYTIYLFKEGYKPRVRIEGPIKEETANEKAFRAHEEYPGLAYAIPFSSFLSTKEEAVAEWAQGMRGGGEMFDGTHNN